MKFAKVVFWIAGVWGVLTLVPLYFMLDLIGRQDPPAITHPQFYYGFVGVALIWQFAFFLTATDPARFRPFILLSVLEKLSYVLAVSVLCLQNRISFAQSVTALPDSLLVISFLIAFFIVRGSAQENVRSIAEPVYSEEVHK